MSELGPWHDSDCFWEETAPIMFPESRLGSAATEVGHAVALLGLPAGASILDLCCGPGRHSLELARRGFSVTAVDRTRAHLEKARKAAAAEGLQIAFVEEDMRRFVRTEAFDGAVNLLTSFGYFEDQEDDLRVLRNLHASLKPGGALAMDLMGREVIARIFKERDWSEREGIILLEERKVVRDWTWMEVRWRLWKDGTWKEFNFSHRVYSGSELADALKKCGFQEVRILGGLNGSPYDHNAQRLVGLARK